jgi:hypothetical protein
VPVSSGSTRGSRPAKLRRREALTTIRARLVRWYESRFSIVYTGKSPRHSAPIKLGGNDGLRADQLGSFVLNVGDPDRFADMTPADFYIP